MNKTLVNSILVSDSEQRLLNIEEEIKSLVQLAEKAWMTTALKLKEISDEKLFRVFGYNTFREYMEERLIPDPSFEFSRRSIAYLLKIARTAEALGLEPAEMAAIGIRKARLITEAATVDRSTGEIKNADQVRELVRGARHLSSNDVREQVRELRGLPPEWMFKLWCSGAKWTLTAWIADQPGYLHIALGALSADLIQTLARRARIPVVDGGDGE